MITLPHSGLKVPQTAIRILLLEEIQLYDGVAYTAHLEVNDQPMGVIKNDDRGGET